MYVSRWIWFGCYGVTGERWVFLAHFKNWKDLFGPKMMTFLTLFWVNKRHLSSHNFEKINWKINAKRSIFQIFWKLHCVTKYLLFELETSNFGYMNIFKFLQVCNVSPRLNNIDVRHFIRVPPMNFWQITKSKNINWGTLIKCLKSMLSNLTESLHS